MKQATILVAVALAGAAFAIVLRRSAPPPRSGVRSVEGRPEATGGRASAGSPPTAPRAQAPQPGRGVVTRFGETKVAEDDPRAPSYDALELATMMKVSNFEVFEREPRDAAWADSMEQALRGVIGDAFVAEFETAEIAEVECRQQSCVVSATVDEEHARSLYRYAQAYVSLGSSVESSFGELSDGRRSLRFAVIYDKQLEDAEGFLAWRQRNGADTVKRERWRREQQERGEVD